MPFYADMKKRVRTTLPRFPIDKFPVLKTERLLLRVLTQDDLQALHVLQLMPEYMAETGGGQPVADLAGSQAWLDCMLEESSRPHFIFGIFLAATGELIGDCGVHSVHGTRLGRPAIYYKLDPAHRRRGYATEAMAALLRAWWNLPREEVEVEAHPASIQTKTKTTTGEGGVDGHGVKETAEKKDTIISSPERVVAEIAAYNTASRRVVEKLGFEDIESWEEPDSRLHNFGKLILIGHYALSRPS
ncbi:acetyltransferase domain-containing protein [Nemania sp. FL0916]|nr:acetyltransferase domain-containing protein [Nemania sp. FL0916]